MCFIFLLLYNLHEIFSMEAKKNWRNKTKTECREKSIESFKQRAG